MGEVEGEKIDSAQVLCIGIANTKLEELKFISHSVRSNLTRFSSNSSPKVWFLTSGFLQMTTFNEIWSCQQSAH